MTPPSGLFGVTIEYLRYGERERPIHDVGQEGELYQRIAEAQNAEGSLTPEVMRDVYIELDDSDRRLISDIAMRLYKAEQRNALFEVAMEMDELFAEEGDAMGLLSKRISRLMPELVDTNRACYDPEGATDEKEH